MVDRVGTGGGTQSVPTRARLVLVACILSSSLVGMDGVMTPVALPAIAEGLQVGLAVQQWVVAAFLLALGSLLLVGGALGDVYNRWLVFGVGTAGFGIAALVSALAPNATILVAGRLMQGMAAALMVPGALAVITTTFDGHSRSRAIATWTAWSGISMIVGPGIAGVLVDALSWRAVYGLLVPLSLIVVVLIFRAAPPATPRATETSVDVAGAVLGVPVVGGPIFALIQGPERGWGHPLVIGAVVLGVVATVGFLWVERRTSNPLVSLELFRSRAFTVLNIITFVLYAAFICGGIYLVLFLQQTAGYAPAAAGLTSVIPIAVLFFFAKPVGALADRHGSRPFIACGAVLVGIGVLLLLRTDTHADFVTVVLPSMLLHGIGLALIVSPLTAGVLAAADEGHAGAASGINNAVARIGSLFGVAVIGVLISMQFSATVDQSLRGKALAPATRQAVEQAKEKPFNLRPGEGVTSQDQQVVERALAEASVGAFRLAIAVIGGQALFAAVLTIVGLGGRHHPRGAAQIRCGSVFGAHQGPHG